MSKGIVLCPISEPGFQHPMLGSSHSSMMQTRALRKCPCFPTLHPCGDYCNEIYAPTLHWHIPADLFEALATEHLTGAGHVLDVDEEIVIDLICSFLEQRSDQS